MAISAIGRFADEPAGAVSLAASGGGIAGASLESLAVSNLDMNQGLYNRFPRVRVSCVLLAILQ